MVVTQNTIRSEILQRATSGEPPVDFRIEDSLIDYWADSVGSKLKAQAIKKRKDISSVWLQTITCLELIQVDKSECCEVETGCTILRTSLQIPRTIETNGEDCIVRITSNNGTLISRTTAFAAKYDSYNKYTSTKPKWFMKNDYIYIINNDFLSHINVTGVFESPSELASYESCDGSTCFDSNANYPCSLEMAGEIADIVYKTKVIPFLQTPRDTTNDASNSLNPPTNTK